MKLTKSKLKQIIKEELLKETSGPYQGLPPDKQRLDPAILDILKDDPPPEEAVPAQALKPKRKITKTGLKKRYNLKLVELPSAAPQWREGLWNEIQYYDNFVEEFDLPGDEAGATVKKISRPPKSPWVHIAAIESAADQERNKKNKRYLSFGLYPCDKGGCGGTPLVKQITVKKAHPKLFYAALIKALRARQLEKPRKRKK